MTPCFVGTLAAATCSPCLFSRPLFSAICLLQQPSAPEYFHRKLDDGRHCSDGNEIQADLDSRRHVNGVTLPSLLLPCKIGALLSGASSPSKTLIPPIQCFRLISKRPKNTSTSIGSKREVNVARYNASNASQQVKQSRRRLGTDPTGRVRFADGAITALIACALARGNRNAARTRL